MSLVYTIAELDALFGFKPQSKGGSWWVNNWRWMVEAHAFPMPLPGFDRCRRLRWSRELVDKWVASNGQREGDHVEIVPTVSLKPNLAALDSAR